MNTWLTKVAMTALLAALAVHGDWQDLHGKVTDESGNPLENAIVTLESSGATVLTKGDGTFSFGQNASINEKTVPGAQSGRIHVQNGVVHFGVAANDATVTISVYNLNGALQRKHRLRVDNARLDLQPIMPPAQGVYLLQLNVNGSSIRCRATRIGCNDIHVSVVNNALKMKMGSLAKSAAIPDSVLARKFGYANKLVKISGYNEMQFIKIFASGLDAVPPGMVKIPAGFFTMGSQTGEVNETPIRDVSVSAFYIDTTEVTQADYFSLINQSPWLEYEEWHPGGIGCRYPVWYITWFDAVIYCNARSKRDNLDTVYVYESSVGVKGNGLENLENLNIDYNSNGYRLPTEAEWEYAARGGASTSYFWGESNNAEVIDTYCWYYQNANSTGHEIAIKEPNPFSLYDILGNMFEFCNDFISSGYVGYTSINPHGISTGTRKVVRGGCWRSNSRDLRCARRIGMFPNKRQLSANLSSIRCVLPIRD
jgi:formylglycine-generating enzyme required for sulfatase activity